MSERSWTESEIAHALRQRLPIEKWVAHDTRSERAGYRHPETTVTAGFARTAQSTGHNEPTEALAERATLEARERVIEAVLETLHDDNENTDGRGQPGVATKGTIEQFEGEYEFLANTSPDPAEYEGVVYACAERAYLAAGSARSWARSMIGSVDTIAAARTIAAENPKRLDWHWSRDGILRHVVESKFRHNPMLTARLLDTGDKTIGNGKPEEGAHPAEPNRLGMVLMEIRGKLLAERSASRARAANTRRSRVSAKQQGLFENSETLAEAATGGLGAPPGTTASPVYETYWRFAAERQRIFMRRARGAQGPWTRDPVLSKFKFTNVYRASDRTSQALIAEIIERDDLPSTPDEMFFRIVLAKLFNKAQTWRTLEREVGPPIWEEYRFNRYAKTLDAARSSGDALYAGAYIMPSAKEAYGFRDKHRNHLKLIETMMERKLGPKIADAGKAQTAYKLLREQPSIGPFLAYQLLTDIGYSPIGRFDESEFTVAGPGARSGIAKCFPSRGRYSEEDIIKALTDQQDTAFEQLGLDFETIGGRALQLIDIQNVCCEVDKYARVAHPAIAGIGARIRIKQSFAAHPTRLKLQYPRKWAIAIADDGAPSP